ncbi:hypothetical protein [Verrucomicrobium sp. BvORR034]|jgi:methyl-accepting chemotaxis protein|uniref:hypothetical protein n=1 Tax=Verrucomicrobium sp. BvORR034 TaxID=1396418 RepID=UPI000678ED76|nr:hypothetical protein [Verrucomicrobium sp. BvORR034]
MRPISSTILVTLLAAVCGLCTIQWYRESDLRQLGVDLRNETTKLAGANQELENRVKAADGEILRLTASLGELRQTSVSKQEHEEQTILNTQLREMAEKQNAAIKQQNESIEKQNALIEQANVAIKQGNETIKKITDERDSLSKKLNETVAKYNKLQAEGAKPANTAAAQ